MRRSTVALGCLFALVACGPATPPPVALEAKLPPTPAVTPSPPTPRGDKTAIARLPIADALPTYRAWAAQDDDTALKIEGLDRVAWEHDAAAMPTFVPALASSDHGVRAAAARGIGEYGPPLLESALPALVKALAEATEVDRAALDFTLADARDAEATRAGRAEDASRDLVSLATADKEARALLLSAIGDRSGAKGLVSALESVDTTNPDRAKFQTKQIFDMLAALADPRGNDALAAYAAKATAPRWRTMAAFRLAETGDLRAVPHLVWRMKQDPLKLYKQDTDPELRRDDSERIVAARHLADLAVLHPSARADLRNEGYAPMLAWMGNHPHANGMRFLAAADATKALPAMRQWANPSAALPKAGTATFPPEWGYAQAGLRYLGWMQDAPSWSLLVAQLERRPKALDATMEALMQGGVAVQGMTLRALGIGAAQGLAQWGDAKAYPNLVKFIEDPMNNEQARLEAGAALAWVATEAQALEVAKKAIVPTTDPKAIVVRECWFEALAHRPSAAATALVDLLVEGTPPEVQLRAARAIGLAGTRASETSRLFAKLGEPPTRVSAALALLLGADADTARRALAVLEKPAIEELLIAYAQSFGYVANDEGTRRALARIAENARVASRSTSGATLDWPRRIFARAIRQVEYDNGPRSLTRVQLRVGLLRDARSNDATKRADALVLLESLDERGVLATLRGEPGPAQEPARQALFRLAHAPKVEGP